jgi:hypothetical protein
MAPTSPHRGPGGRDESRPYIRRLVVGALFFAPASSHPVGAMDHATATSHL